MFDVQRVSSLSRLGIKAGPFADLRLHVSSKGLKFFEAKGSGGKVGTLPASDIVGCQAEVDRGMIKVTAERKMTSWSSQSVYSLAVKGGRAQELCTLIKSEVGLSSPAVDQLFHAVKEAKEMRLAPTDGDSDRVIDSLGGADAQVPATEASQVEDAENVHEHEGGDDSQAEAAQEHGMTAESVPLRSAHSEEASSGSSDSEDSWTDEEGTGGREVREGVEDAATFLFSGEAENGGRERAGSMRGVEQAWGAENEAPPPFIHSPQEDLATIEEVSEGSPSPAASPRSPAVAMEEVPAPAAGAASPVRTIPALSGPEAPALPHSSEPQQPPPMPAPTSPVAPVGSALEPGPAPPLPQASQSAFQPYPPPLWGGAPYLSPIPAVFHAGGGFLSPDLSGGGSAAAQSPLQQQLQEHSAALGELRSAMRDKDSVIAEQSRLIEALEEKLSGSGKKLQALEWRVREQDAAMRERDRRERSAAYAGSPSLGLASQKTLRSRAEEPPEARIERSPAIEGDIKRLLNLTFEGMDLIEALDAGSSSSPMGATARLERRFGTPPRTQSRSPLHSPRGVSPEPNFLEAVLIEAYEDGVEGLFSGLNHEVA